MISILMPYWRRQERLDATLDSLEQYDDIEVCICADGCTIEIKERPYPVKVMHLPMKDEPKNPCVPFNWARKLAEGEYLCITNPEILHPEPVLPAMLEALVGDRGYVLATCWNPEKERWHCRAGYVPPHTAPIPKGSGLHFCALMRADFYDEIGGFSEEYRDGAGYDDNDFIWKVHEAGGIIKIVPETVHHFNTGIKWPAQMVERNKRIFYGKWAKYLTQS